MYLNEQISLTVDEFSELNRIYYFRKRFFIGAFIAITFMIILMGYPTFYIIANYDLSPLKQDDRLKLYARMWTYIGLEIIFTISFTIIYLKKIHRLKRDINENIKVPVYTNIYFKRHFPHTNQYFFKLEHTKREFYEVQANTFYSYNTGDRFVIYKAPISGHIFNECGNFEL